MNNGRNMDGLGISTTSVWGGCDPEQWKDWDLMPPISTTSTYKQVRPGDFKRFDYSRFGNPTRASLEKALAILENAKFGLVFTSGSAAIATAIHLLSAGDHIVAGDDLYTGTTTYFTKVGVISRMNIETIFVDATVTENVLEAMQPNTKMIWLEIASNPKLKVVDLEAIVRLAKKKNPDVIILVDNTFLTPCILRPLDLGADVSLMSCSKYINGHHDIVMGSLAVVREDLYEKLLFLQQILGGVPGGPDCYQVLRSLKTLPLRMQRHQENGLAIAEFLSRQPSILSVNHPLLKSHPQYKLSQLQQKGKHSGMVSFLLAGTPENASKFVMSLKVVLLATSLGGTHTTIINTDLRKPNFFRLSVGIEDAHDLIRDLEQAINQAFC